MMSLRVFLPAKRQGTQYHFYKSLQTVDEIIQRIVFRKAIIHHHCFYDFNALYRHYFKHYQKV